MANNNYYKDIIIFVASSTKLKKKKLNLITLQKLTILLFRISVQHFLLLFDRKFWIKLKMLNARIHIDLKCERQTDYVYIE